MDWLDAIKWDRDGLVPVIAQEVGSNDVLMFAHMNREALRRTDFARRRKELRGTGRGIGLSLFFHGSGFTGAGEVKLASRAALELTPLLERLSGVLTA